MDSPDLDSILDAGLSGASDDGSDIDAGDGASTTTDDGTPSASAPADASAAAAGTDVDTEPEGDTFPRDYVEKLRRENQTYRQRAQEAEQYAEVFAGFEDPEDRQYLTELVKMTASQDPEVRAQAAEQLANLAEFIRPEPADPGQVLGPADIQRMVDRGVQQALNADRQEQSVRDIERQAQSLGYDIAEGSRDYINLLFVAQHQTGGDIAEAHKIIEGERAALTQKAIDEFLASKGTEAANGITPAPRTGVAPSTEQPIKSIEDGRKALQEFLATQ